MNKFDLIKTLSESKKKTLSEEQLAWIKQHMLFQFKGNDEILLQKFRVWSDGTVSYNESQLTIVDFDEGFEPPVPFKFKYIQRLRIASGTVLTTFDIFPEKAFGVGFLNDEKMPSLKGLSKVLKECKTFRINTRFKNGMIEFFKIRGLEDVSIYSPKSEKNRTAKFEKKISKAVKILNKWLKEKDPFGFQNEMEDEGLREFL